ncbi:hypothetical protein [Campylobacter sp.]|nr:hypothetical protein [Campylobacter sp.]
MLHCDGHLARLISHCAYFKHIAFAILVKMLFLSSFYALCDAR